MTAFKARQVLGKFRVERKLASGGFAAVYQAYDTIEGVRVALKVPHPHMVHRETLNLFKQEVKVNALLDHPNILPIKYAGYINEQFVIVYPLGLESLEQRLRRRLAVRKALDLAGQMLDGAAFAHGKGILHSDLKPENFILFPGDQLRLADFGLAKLTFHTLTGSGSGTVGYLAPEQAMGKPSPRSDVFSLGLIIYRMLAGALPHWPFEWPPPNHDRLRAKVHADLVALLRRAIEVDHRKRFRDAQQMRQAFVRIKPRVLSGLTRRKRRRGRGDGNDLKWKKLRIREFLAKYGSKLEVNLECPGCGGPVSEPMQVCPWCGTGFAVRHSHARFPASCPRCRRGRKLDWRYCAWCYGGAFRKVSTRKYTDVRYTARCSNAACADRRLMPFMKYCPWCRRKVRRAWPIPGSRERCRRCGWGVLGEFWTHCPWCGLERRRRT